MQDDHVRNVTKELSRVVKLGFRKHVSDSSRAAKHLQIAANNSEVFEETLALVAKGNDYCSF